MAFKGIEFLNYEEKLALFYGIMLGDGCLSNGVYKRHTKHTICITGSIYGDKEFFDSLIIPLVKDLNNRDVKYHERPNLGSLDLRFEDIILFNKLKDLGFIVGHKGPMISIPDFFNKYNLMINVTRGFIATDGSLVLTKNPNKFYPRIEANGISKPLILGIFKFLSDSGLQGHIYKAKRLKLDGGFRHLQDQYRFQFNGPRNLDLFCRKIGFINSKHFCKLNTFYEYSKVYDEKLKYPYPNNKRRIRDKLNLEYYNIWR
ncbi:hypothetical protein J4471_00315 [Candidatus Woesearchaeota archaeon]|nr:hypothetical protein [Candidatus Woesearchaeota archaeon]